MIIKNSPTNNSWIFVNKNRKLELIPASTCINLGETVGTILELTEFELGGMLCWLRRKKSSGPVSHLPEWTKGEVLGR